MQSRLKFEWLNFRGRFERKALVRNYGREKIKYPPIFIIGTPRSGSTILYQLLTNYFPVQYFSNYMIDRFQVIFSASKNQVEKNGFAPHSTFNSEYGETASDLGPSEGSYFWYQWLPFDRHFVGQHELTEKTKKEIYSELTALVNYHNRPIIIKNLNCSVRLQALKEIFPDLLLIHIKRDPLYTVQSIYQARIKLKGSPENWVSVMPKEYDQVKNLPVEEQLASQVYFIENQIEDDKKLFDPSHYHELSFEDLCAGPSNELSRIEKFFLMNGLSLPCSSPENLKIADQSNHIYLDSPIFEKLKMAVEKRFQTS